MQVNNALRSSAPRLKNTSPAVRPPPRFQARQSNSFLHKPEFFDPDSANQWPVVPHLTKRLSFAAGDLETAQKKLAAQSSNIGRFYRDSMSDGRAFLFKLLKKEGAAHWMMKRAADHQHDHMAWERILGSRTSNATDHIYMGTDVNVFPWIVYACEQIFATGQIPEFLAHPRRDPRSMILTAEVRDGRAYVDDLEIKLRVFGEQLNIVKPSELISNAQPMLPTHFLTAHVGSKPTLVVTSKSASRQFQIIPFINGLPLNIGAMSFLLPDFATSDFPLFTLTACTLPYIENRVMAQQLEMKFTTSGSVALVAQPDLTLPPHANLVDSNHSMTNEKSSEKEAHISLLAQSLGPVFDERLTAEMAKIRSHTSEAYLERVRSHSHIVNTHGWLRYLRHMAQTNSEAGGLNLREIPALSEADGTRLHALGILILEMLPAGNHPEHRLIGYLPLNLTSQSA